MDCYLLTCNTRIVIIITSPYNVDATAPSRSQYHDWGEIDEESGASCQFSNRPSRGLRGGGDSAAACGVRVGSAIQPSGKHSEVSQPMQAIDLFGVLSPITGECGGEALRLLSRLWHAVVIKIVPPHHVPQRLLTQVGTDKMLPLRRSDPTMDLASRPPAEETRHLPVDKSHDLVIVDDAVGRAKVVVHETYIRVSIGIREDNVPFEWIDTVVGADVGIFDDIAASPPSVSGFNSVQQPKYLPCLLLKTLLLTL